ncbi:MAG TPA: 1,4-alpha-glucan branching protein GlgB [Rhodanobacteraceae bacterium]|nr:1,4-alpha-glucan branching protein GlgB [Rhodanobacteraceae bacterium]
MALPQNKPDAFPSGRIEAVVTGDCGDPFAVLGPHKTAAGKVLVRVFLPDARALWLVDRDGRVRECRRVHLEGLWQGELDRAVDYRVRAETPDGQKEFEDAYRFGPVLGDLDVYLLAEGTHLRNYTRLGAHPMTRDGVEGTAFAVWAPNARRASVVGDFCGWDGRRLPMRKRHECGVWELFVPHVAEGAFYKFEIKSGEGALLPLKADPYAFHAEQPPRTASIVDGCREPAWSDDGWMASRAAAQACSAPVSIYEVHAGSWRRKGDGTYLSYEELAERLIPYVRDLGFTHIELMPISEYPFDGSWGYQPIGLYAPTSRFGTPEQFARFVDRCHQQGIGVLLDWVPAHFPTDPHGLQRFDGTHLYEHADPRQGFHRDWNTLIFNYGRREVANYLLGNALFWLHRYHADGLRVDAVASMLYLDYSRKPGEWVPNRFGGRENLDAVDFLKRMNGFVQTESPGAITIAEESTAWPGVSRPARDGGLGFAYKWNMGWMHDTLAYMREDPVHRAWHHHKLTFGLHYAFSENFVLPLSHDEVVHGKRSLLEKMPGDEWQRFANLRAYFGFMWGHPGKKLLFMGGEFAQRSEWTHDAELEWHRLEQPQHGGVQTLVRDLNRVYRECSALHELDCDAQGFQWLEMNDQERSVYAFLRWDTQRARPMLVVCNFTPVPRQAYRVGVPFQGFWRERINTDALHYGGSGLGNLGGVHAEAVPWHGQPQSVSLVLPPLATLFLEPDGQP